MKCICCKGRRGRRLIVSPLRETSSCGYLGTDGRPRRSAGCWSATGFHRSPSSGNTKVVPQRPQVERHWFPISVVSSCFSESTANGLSLHALRLLLLRPVDEEGSFADSAGIPHARLLFCWWCTSVAAPLHVQPCGFIWTHKSSHSKLFTGNFLEYKKIQKSIWVLYSSVPFIYC